MFNYVGTIVRKRPYDIVSGNLDIYDVRVAQFSNAEVPARVLAPAGLAVSYSQGDTVVVGELEPDKYLILGSLQKKGETNNFPKLGQLATINLIAEGGTLYGAVQFVINPLTQEKKTVATLLDEIRILKEEVERLKSTLSAFSNLIPPANNNV